MSVRAPDTPDFDWKVSDHVCAFYNEGVNLPDDIIVDYLSKGLRAGNKCAFFCFADTASRVRGRIPSELMTRQDVLQFFTADDDLLKVGGFSKAAFQRNMEALVEDAVSRGYERLWAGGDAAFVVRNSLPLNEWFAWEAELNDHVPQWPWFGICLYSLDRFDGELVMKVLQTHPRMFVNGMIIDNPYYVPTREFLSSL
jgi:hypothetical protein